jgi:hypothetical protein
VRQQVRGGLVDAAMALAGAFGTRFEKRQGSSTFSRTDRNGSRLNCWKM